MRIHVCICKHIVYLRARSSYVERLSCSVLCLASGRSATSSIRRFCIHPRITIVNVFAYVTYVCTSVGMYVCSFACKRGIDAKMTLTQNDVTGIR